MNINYQNTEKITDLDDVVGNSGSRYWFKDNQLHRSGDKPAMRVSGNGYSNKRWMLEGQYHRRYRDKPAIINNSKQWYKRGKLHRSGDRPAVITYDGKISFFEDGVSYNIEVSR